MQSRIKAIEREVVVEAVEEDEKQFRFSFPDSGQLGRPVIQIEGVTFGFNKDNILFRDVHLGIEQASRIALVGPNVSNMSNVSYYRLTHKYSLLYREQVNLHC